MKDMMASLEKLRADAAEAALIRELATETEAGVIHQTGRPLRRPRSRGRARWQMAWPTKNSSRLVVSLNCLWKTGF
jgi:hypothetical protein